jgi:hypothetical protein
LRKFWAALVAKMKAMWNKLRGWWKKMTDAAPKIKARAEALAKKSADISGQAEERTIELALSSQLHIGGRTPQPNTAVDQVKNLAKACDGFIGSQSKGQMEKISSDFGKMLQAIESGDRFKGSTAKTLTEAYNDPQLKAAANGMHMLLVKDAKDHEVGLMAIGKGNASDLETRFGKDSDHGITTEMLGGRAIVASRTKDTFYNSPEYTLGRDVRGCSIRFTDFLAKPKEIDGTGEFKTMSSSDIRSVCDNIADLMDNIIE